MKQTGNKFMFPKEEHDVFFQTLVACGVSDMSFQATFMPDGAIYEITVTNRQDATFMSRTIKEILKR
jgi:hypothetical protein